MNHNLQKKLLTLSRNIIYGIVIQCILYTGSLAGDAKALKTPGKAKKEGENTSFQSVKDITVKGKVTSMEDGSPIPGVNVLVKGTSIGTATDLNGAYNINVPDENSILVFSSIGYTSEDVIVGSRSQIDVTMVADIQQLSEIVVIGYGTVKKSDLTGSVASVKSGDIVTIPTANPMNAIQGRVAGVDITRKDGQAGSGVNILIRGTRSIDAKNDPLFIIDGIQGGNFEDVNPSDIESIEVLKDASATSIYGSRGANGVVIITTKKGITGATKISYESYYGVNGLAKYPKPLMGDAFIKMRQEAVRNSKVPSQSLFGSDIQTAIDNEQWVNWIDEVMETGRQQSHQLSIRGGNEKTQSFISGSYFDEKGLFYNDNAKRYTARLNLDHEINKWLKAGMYSQFAYWNINARKDAVLGNANQALPLGTPYDENGIVLKPIAGNTAILSPLADNIENAAINNTSRINTVLKGYLEVKPMENLSLRSNVGATFNTSRQGIFNDINSIAQIQDKKSKTEINNVRERLLIWENVLNFKKQLGEHNINITGVVSYNNELRETDQMFGFEQLISTFSFHNISATNAASRTINSTYTEKELMSYAGRIDYNFKGKYLLTTSLRADGASQLSVGNKWDYFPSVAAGWRISDENFMQNISVVNDLKLRASYGITGNAAVDPYATQSTVQAGDPMGFGDVAVPTFKYGEYLANSSLGWETSKTVDVGLDVAILRNRINLTADVYNTNTTDLLLKRRLPTSAGGTGKDPFVMAENVGKTNSKGLELALNTVNIQTKTGLEWRSAVTFTTSKDKIIALYNGDIIDNTTMRYLFEGHPVNIWYDFKKLGIWQLDEADVAATYFNSKQAFKPGDIKLANIADVDTVPNEIDAVNDRTVLGQKNPKWFLGFNNTVTYKGFDLTVYAFMRWGQMINYQPAGRYNPAGDGGQPGNYNYWTPENPSNDYPAPSVDTRLIDIFGYTSLNYIDGSYFKLKTVSLGYTLPQALTSKIRIDRLRVYCTANNVFTKSKSHLLNDYDPERGGEESFPMSKQYVFGVNLDF